MQVRPRYVREAYRLLRKSIIHVESEDVVLEEDSDDEHQHDANNNNNNNGNDDDDNDDNDAAAAVAAAAGRSSRSSSHEDTDAAAATPAAGGTAGSVRRDAPPSPGGPQSTPAANEAPRPRQRGKTGAAGADDDAYEEGQGEVPEGDDAIEQGEGEGEPPRGKRRLGDAPGGSKRLKKAKKAATKISFEQYQVMTNSIVAYIHRREEQRSSSAAAAAAAAASSNADEDSESQSQQLLLQQQQQHRTARWGDVVDWYCSQHEHELEGEQHLLNMKKLLNSVIGRLISKDGVLICIREAEEQADKAIIVHPNYSGGR
jgi:MCM6 C-terminal winged-helix domain